MIILDTNVVSEFLRPEPPDPDVEAWLDAQSKLDIYLTTISEAELKQGVGLMPPGRRRDKLANAIEAILAYDLEGRILPFDRAAAQAYAPIFALRRRIGRPINVLDCQIAAIAHSRSATVATRNTGDFENCGIEIINPWLERA